IPGAAQIDAKIFDLLAETLETRNVELSALEQGGRGLSLASLTMPCQQRLPGIQVELRHAATHVKPRASSQICRTATQHQLTAAVSPVASRCLERQRGNVAVLDHVAPRLVAQGNPQAGVAALAGRLADRRRQLERRPQQRGIDLQLAGLTVDIQ